MKPESQRIAIAEARGWKRYRLPVDTAKRPPLFCLAHPVIHKDWISDTLLPADGTERMCGATFLWREGGIDDYLNDLDAMHETEVQCIYARGLGMVYLRNLNDFVNAQPPFEAFGVSMQRWGASATADQRAEVVLRTLGLWRDDE